MPFSQYNDSKTKGGSSRWGSSSSSGRATSKWSSSTNSTTTKDYDTDSVDRSIENAKIRIQDSGGKVDKDTRNRVEKALNLPEKQNWVFDTLDVLNRPQQALYGGIDALSKSATGTPTNRDEAFMKGLKGETKLRGKEVLSGMLGAVGVKGRKGTGAAGFVVDVATDPLNLIPAAAISKIARPVGKTIKGAVKGARDGLESAVPKLKDLRETKLEPAIDAIKEGLGKTFKYQHGWNRTLDGGTDDALKNTFNATENDIKFRTDEALKGVSESAKLAGGVKKGADVGRVMEKDLQVYGPRPLREMSSDPKIVKAADNLMQSNKELRDWANGMGVDIPELEGYMKHVWTQAERTRRNTRKGKLEGNFGLGQPNKKVVASRKLDGSAEDINQELGRDFFTPNAFFASAIGQKQLIEYAGATKFRNDVLSNPSFAMPYDKSMGPPPPGTVVVNPDQFKFFKATTEEGRDVMAVAKGKEFLMTPGAVDALKRFDYMNTDEGLKAIKTAVDFVQGTWKKLTLLSGAYHARNIVGGMFNAYVSGMDVPSLARYTASAGVDVAKAVAGKETPLYREFRQQGLGSSGMSRVEFEMGKDPENAVEKLVKDQSKGKTRKVADRLNPLNVFKTSREIGDTADQVNRFALFKYWRDKGATAEEAAAKVREVHFDYTRTTNAEREVLARAMPFYRWVRNNVPYQIKQFANNPQAYANANKLRLDAQQEFMDPNDPESNFFKNQFAVPVSDDQFISLNLPLTDLIRMENPVKMATDSLSPFVKTPIEFVSNYDLFRNKKISEFSGDETKYDVPFGGPRIGIPKKTDHVLRQFGGQPARQLSKALEVDSADKDQKKFVDPTLGISSILKPFDPKKEAYFRKLEELKALQDQINDIEEETGFRPSTVNEIKKKGRW